jgi:hypothetical protein
MAQVFQYPYIYVYVCVCVIVASRGKGEEERKNDRADNPKTRVWQLTQAQSHRPAPKTCASHRCSKMRPAAIKTSRADFRS